MAFSNQATTSMADFISKLNTFTNAITNWTTTHTPASGEWAARKTPAGIDIAMATQWNTSTPDFLGLYQWHGAAYVGGATRPWQQNDDSGNGQASATVLDENGRSAEISDAPIQFWAFEDDHYLHVVVQRTSIEYVHFGCGLLDKFNDWTGGEYVYGHWQDQVNGAGQAVDIDSTMLLDGLANDQGASTFSNTEERVATLHIEDMDNQGASEMWGVVMGDQLSTALGQDRQTVPEDRIHILGGYRAGPIGHPFGLFRGTLAKGNSPMYPIVIHYWNRTTDNVYPLGQMKDVRGVNIRDFAPGQEITIGSDTWVMFPSARKALVDNQSGTGYSQHQGIAYKKVTT